MSDSDGLLFERDTCSALVITCSDFRFKSCEQAFAITAGLQNDYDLIARPGAIRSLVLPRNAAARESMEEETRLLWRLHRFTRVLMVNHLSCRAYDDIATTENEREVHTAHLIAAAPLIENLLEGITAEPYIVEMVRRTLTVNREALP
jgi:hypothetical protein